MGTISIYVARESSSCLWLLQRLSKISNQLWLGFISNYYICAECWSMRFRVCPVRAESLFLTNFWLSHTQALKAFKVRCSGCPSSQWNIFRLGGYYGVQTPHFLGRISAIVIVFLFVACLPRGDDRKQQNSIKQLSFNKKNKLKKMSFVTIQIVKLFVLALWKIRLVAW